MVASRSSRLFDLIRNPPSRSAVREGYRVARSHGRRHVMVVDHPPASGSRWGHGRPTHPLLEGIVDPSVEPAALRLAQHVDRDLVASVPLTAGDDDASPRWWTPWIAPLDSATLVAMVAELAPRRFVEIGSGHTTRFARYAVDRFSTGTHITSIDPEPRVVVDDLCDEVIRAPLETLGTGRFEDLIAGDIVFLDGSHRALTGSDVVVLFLEILPRLEPGVVVHVHDVFIPADYPPSWAGRHYSEQYLLAAQLLAAPESFEVLAANNHLAQVSPASLRAWEEAVGLPAPESPDLFATSFWFRRSA